MIWNKHWTFGNALIDPGLCSRVRNIRSFRNTTIWGLFIIWSVLILFAIPYQTNIPANPRVANALGSGISAPVVAPAIPAGAALSTSDVTRAMEEEQRKEGLYRAGVVTPEELGLAKTREVAVTAENAAVLFPAAGAPAWFVPAMQVAIQVALQPLRVSIDRAWNSSAGDGLTKPWNVIPFVNGEDPTDGPHNLPQIRNLNDLNQLNGAQLIAYLAGYGQQVPNPIATRRRSLGQFLGYYGP